MSRIVVKPIRETLSRSEEVVAKVILEAISFKIYDKDKVDEIIEHAKYVLRERCGLILDCDVIWNAPTINAQIYSEIDERMI